MNLTKISAIARVTFSDLIRDRVLYNILFVSIALFLIALLTAQLSVLSRDRIVIDFGLAGQVLSLSFVALFYGSNLIRKEMERRTLGIALSRPCSRFEFLLGKYLGLVALIALDWLLLTLSFLLIVGNFTEASWANLSLSLFAGIFFSLLEALVVAAFAIGLSVPTSKTLAIFVTVSLMIIGSNVTQWREVISKIEGGTLIKVLRWATYFFPQFELYHLGTQLAYSVPVGFEQVLLAMIHTAFFVSLMLFIGGVSLRNKELLS